jgi:hypothetical protein
MKAVIGTIRTMELEQAEERQLAETRGTILNRNLRCPLDKTIRQEGNIILCLEFWKELWGKCKIGSH